VRQEKTKYQKKQQTSARYGVPHAAADWDSYLPIQQMGRQEKKRK
jgi:hypothetical protein